MAQVCFKDKVGGLELLDAKEGQSIKELLRMCGIPANSVITYINGNIVSEETAIIEADDQVELSQVRHYDLNTTRKPPTRRLGIHENPIYSKSIFFDKNGDMEVRSEDFDSDAFVHYIEQTFIESVLRNNILAPNVPNVIGLSGGRDSVAFLKILERTQDKLPNVNLKAVTVTGIPDWDEPGTFGAAINSCKSLGIEHIIVNGESIAEHFHLNRSFAEVMTEVVAGEKNAMVMVTTHHIMRRMIELEAEKRGIKEVLLGLNADDLVASLVTWFTSGFQMGGIPIRNIGSFRYSFPLHQITKKELTIYLKTIAPELTGQGAPGRFTTGPDERSLAYAIADHLYELWPGIDYYLFESYSNMQKYNIPKEEGNCENCGATYMHQKGFQILPNNYCDICNTFQELGLLQPQIVKK